MSVLTYFIVSAVILLFIDIAFFIICKKSASEQIPAKKKDDLNKGFIYLSILFFICGYIYFFNDSSMQFECLKETMTCTYSHSTEYDQTIRPVRTYDFSNIKRAKVTSHHRRKSGTYYTADFIEKKGRTAFKMPHDFSRELEAREEVRKINRFLSSHQKKYVFVNMPDGISPDKSFFILCLILIFFILSSQILYFLKIIPRDFDGFVQLPADIDEEIKKDLKEDGLSDEEIDAFLKEINKDADNRVKTIHLAESDDVIQRTRKI
ncbi:MAG: hypothetical protein J5716_08555 [Alphaproteobacteria bacterium]|nr:hypothetical protein [Alphaproteobacteria bacterium]